MVLGRCAPRATIARFAWRRRSVLGRSCRRIRRYSCSFPLPGERLATGCYRVQSRQDGLVPADWPQEKKIAHAMRYRHWHHAAKIGGRRLGWVDRLVRDRLPRRKPKRDLKFYLAPSRYRDAEQECDKQARERSFPGNGADGRKRLSWLARRGNGLTQSVDRGAQCGGGFRDGARQVGCGIDSAVRHAGPGCRL